jgi:hypothetical protein
VCVHVCRLHAEMGHVLSSLWINCSVFYFELDH